MYKALFISFISLSLSTLSCNVRSPRSETADIAWADSISEHARSMMERSGPASLRYLDSAFLTKENIGNQALWRKYAAKVNYYQHYEHNFTKRRTYVDSMLLVSAEDKETLGYEYAHSLYAMAVLLQEERKYNQAFAYYYQGRTFAAGKVDNCSMADFSNALGITRYRQEQYRHALPYLMQAYAQISACKSPMFQYSFTLRQSLLNSIGLSYEKSGQIDSAIASYNKAIAFIRSQESRHPGKEDFIESALGIVEGNLGGSYALLGDVPNAVIHLKRDIELNDRDGFAIEHAQIAKINLIKLYISQNQLPEASVLLDRMEGDLKSQRGRSIYHFDIWSRWYAAKSSYYEKQADSNQAFSYLKKYVTLRDSLATEAKTLRDVDVDHLLQEQHQRFELNLLQKSSQLKTVSLIALSVILALAIWLAAILWRNYRQSRRNVKELTILNGRAQQALSALEQSERENMRLVKIVAHDLRGPVGAIASLSDLMIAGSDLSPDDSETMTVIRDTAKNSLDLVNNLMHMQQPQSAQLTTEQVDLTALVRQCANMLSVKANEKQQKIHLELAPVRMQLNYENMWRVVGNLISNAIKFSGEGGEIRVRLTEDGAAVHLYVSDNGIGIPEHIGNAIFDSFTSAKRKGTSGEESFGLGLSITRQIVQAHGGEISFESRPNEGTVFHVELKKG